ncbi:hypothetical protein CIW49_02555 [Mycolicibacterium sp. P1-18]|uniref:hypothetical protein n=1 Tax=Mycolicibacterium sp. P1-18 TaxID=2024615 RepID=UPI0011F19322|nr:hypothetical protein [Mycolicibacterium sp. P1-18]KAA0102217.1 hypothetical protein CIW49_02555 [Mycolicibacterium sp. P1-18]
MDEHPGAVWAAGAAAVALLAVLVVAVVRMSGPSVAPDVQLPASSSAGTSETRYTTSSTSTSYAVPSVQTSEDGGGPAPTDAPTTGDPATDEPTSVSTSTTPANPYGTTTPTNAGHV